MTKPIYFIYLWLAMGFFPFLSLVVSFCSAQFPRIFSQHKRIVCCVEPKPIIITIIIISVRLLTITALCECLSVVVRSCNFHFNIRLARSGKNIKHWKRIIDEKVCSLVLIETSFSITKFEMMAHFQSQQQTFLWFN